MPPKQQYQTNNNNNSSNNHPSHKRKKNYHHHNNNTNSGYSRSGGGYSHKAASHALSWALRHGAPELGLRMTSDGYTPVADLIAHPHYRLSKITSLNDQIRPLVETNDKQRFKLALRPAALFIDSRQKPCSSNNNNNPDNTNNTNSINNWSVIPLTPEQAAPVLLPVSGDHDDDTGEFIWCIRANQGHSLQGINPDYLLQEIPPNELATLPMIVHGTYWDAWHQIQASGGLSRMNRTHIHFAAGLAVGGGREGGVISGMRKSCQILVYVNGAKCAQDGIAFYRSDNGVLLTAGIHNQGVLPMKYILFVTDSSGKSIFPTSSDNNHNMIQKNENGEANKN